jgi:hypothetical protein
MTDQRRTEWIQIRVSKAEKKAIERAAAEAGYRSKAGLPSGVAAWVRALALGEVQLPGKVIRMAPREGR